MSRHVSSLSCFHCGAEVTNGLALCETCQAGARVYFEFLPVHFRNLARWKPGRAGGRPVPGSRVPPGVRLDSAKVGTGDKISDRLDEALTMLTTWARALTKDRTLDHTRPLTAVTAMLCDEYDTDPADAVRLLCAGLDEHLTSVATLDWCGELVRELGDHERRLRQLTEEYVPGWYSGGCKTCDCGTWVVPGQTWVTCGGCGTTTAARDHLETLLSEARTWLARPKPLAEAIVALVDTEQSVPRLYDRIRKWAEKEDITAIRRTERGYAYDIATERMVVATLEVGQARYRLGEVLEKVLAKPAVANSTAKAS